MHTWWKLHEQYENELENLPTEMKATDAATEPALSQVEPPGDEQPEDEATVEAKEEDAKVIALNKRAKMDKKRVAKEVKKALKVLEQQRQKDILELEDKLKADKAVIDNAFQTKKETMNEEKQEKLKKIEESLAASLQDESGLYAKMTSFIFGEHEEL